VESFNFNFLGGLNDSVTVKSGKPQTAPHFNHYCAVFGLPKEVDLTDPVKQQGIGLSS